MMWLRLYQESVAGLQLNPALLQPVPDSQERTSSYVVAYVRGTQSSWAPSPPLSISPSDTEIWHISLKPVYRDSPAISVTSRLQVRSRDEQRLRHFTPEQSA